MERLRAFIPLTEKEYKKGYGEGCYFIVSAEVKAAYDKEETGTTYKGILDTDSMHYPELKQGQELPLEMRGIDSPIVPYKAIKKQRKETIIDLIKQLEEYLEANTE